MTEQHLSDANSRFRPLQVVTACALLVSAMLLGGCGSSMTPGMTQSVDAEITMAIQRDIGRSYEIEERQVSVETRDGVVYLSGVVDTEEARREAGRIAWRAEGVNGVENYVAIGMRVSGNDVIIGARQ